MVPFRCLRAAALAALSAACPAAAAEEPAATPPLARLVVESKGAPDAARVALERDLALALVRHDDCPVRLTRPGDTESAAELEIRVVLGLWREKQEPGGAPVFDPMTNREKPGILHRVDAQYDVAVRIGDEPQPRQAKSFRGHASAATERVPIDPVFRARREMAGEILRDVSRLLCRALRGRRSS